MHKTNRFIHLLILVTLILLWPTTQASAMLTRCRHDPIFMLSNGDKLNVTLDIGADEANLSRITYVLHVPSGVTVTKVTYTAGGKVPETYKVYQDSPAKTYTTDTVVTTQDTSRVTVMATTRLNATFAKSVSGYNNQHLIVTVSKP